MPFKSLVLSLSVLCVTTSCSDSPSGASLRDDPTDSALMPSELAQLSTLTLASKMARASSAAYLDEPSIRARGTGYLQGYEVEVIERGDVRLFVATGPTDVVVAFRGTQLGGTWSLAFRNVARDANICMTSIRGTPRNARFHRGFINGVQNIYSDLEQVLRTRASTRKTVWLTGHSLGGALAQIASVRLRDFHLGEVTTFGAPAVGNAGAVGVVNGSNFRVRRYFHPRDPVAQLPPPLGGYARAPTETNVTTNSLENGLRLLSTATLGAGFAFSAHSIDSSYIPTIEGLSSGLRLANSYIPTIEGPDSGLHLSSVDEVQTAVFDPANNAETTPTVLAADGESLDQAGAPAEDCPVEEEEAMPDGTRGGADPAPEAGPKGGN